jgi:carbonic anhydrase
MVSLHHIRTVTRHREVLVYAVTTLGVVALGVLEGVALGVAVAVAVALHRLARTRVTHDEKEGVHYVHVRGQLTFLAVPRLSRALHLVPQGTRTVVELDGSFMDHAAFEALQDWQRTHTAQGGSVELTGRRAGVGIAEPADGAGAAGCRCRPWTPWRNHQCAGGSRTASAPGGQAAGSGSSSGSRSRSSGPRSRPAPGFGAGSGPASGSGQSRQQLARGISTFQRNTAPLVREELARLAREGQQPSQLFLTCADSRLVTSMITSSGPGDLFVVRNVGNLVPSPGEDSGDDSVAAAIEYAVEVLAVRSVTVCGHSGCGAMQALLDSRFGEVRTPLGRWLRHGLPSLERMAGDGRSQPGLSGRRPADATEQLCLTNVVQQLDHLRAHDAVARALGKGALELHGMYFHVGEAQAYLLTGTDGKEVFTGVGPAMGLHSPA